jgi:hypothetical protein
MTTAIMIDIERPGFAAALDPRTRGYEVVPYNKKNLCNGYGYFKDVDGREKLIAIFAADGRLFLLLDSLFEIDANDTSAELKAGMLKNTFQLFKGDQLVLSVKYKPTFYDAGVLEDVADMLREKRTSKMRVEHLTKLLSETDPEKRKRIDGNKAGTYIDALSESRDELN